MQDTTNPRASGEPSTGAFTSYTRPLPTRLPAAFTLKGVSQVKAGITVLDGVEVDIPHGDIIALVGPSGAGKTSLLRLLNRLDDPVRGEILYRARPITHYPVQALRRHVGFVFQAPVMFPGTVRDNLLVALALGGDHGQDADTRVAEAMALAELDRALCDRAGCVAHGRTHVGPGSSNSGSPDGDDTPLEPGAAPDRRHGHASLGRSAPHQR